MEGMRSFTRDDGTSEARPWVGDWYRYAERDGMRVPTEGEVAWVHPGVGGASYWQGQIETITYQTERAVTQAVASGTLSGGGSADPQHSGQN